jgi:hypothetical protein
MLPDRSLTALERQLSLRRERLELAMARRTKQHLIPRTPLQPPSLVRLQALAKQVETFPVRRRLLKRSEFKIYLAGLHRLWLRS